MKNKRLIRNLVSLFIFANSAHCGRAHEDIHKSGLKVTNGIIEQGEFPEVVRLDFNSKGDDWICTATFVNDHQALTAAHCVEGFSLNQRSTLTFAANGASIGALGIARHPLFTYDPKKASAFDLALVTFPPHSAPAVSALSLTQAKPRDSFTIVGFGINQFALDAAGKIVMSGGKVKRFGKNQIGSIEQGLINFYGSIQAVEKDVAQGQWVSSGAGDSGGPMFLNGKVIGVASGSALSRGSGAGGLAPEKVSRYVDLSQSRNQEFLSKNLH